jgi:hypothetical protein
MKNQQLNPLTASLNSRLKNFNDPLLADLNMSSSGSSQIVGTTVTNTASANEKATSLNVSSGLE